jgi:hypothetical protein
LQEPLPNLTIVTAFLPGMEGQRTALSPRPLRCSIHDLQPAFERLIARGPVQQLQKLAEIVARIHDDRGIFHDAPDRPRQSSWICSFGDPSSALAIDRQAQAGTKNRQRLLRVPLTGEIDVPKRGAIQSASQT